MNGYEQLIQRLKSEIELPHTTVSQREANMVSLQWIEWMSKERPAPSPTVHTDVIMERLKNNAYICSPSRLISRTS